MSPYRIEGPACISFSGGRSSGYMLRQILDAHDGVLPDDVRVLFANTGKEMPQTLDFVQECSERWSVPVTWLEYRDHETQAERWRVVDYASASRNGEPFESLIRRKNFLPNPVTRFCTSEMKVNAIARYLNAAGWNEWTTVMGIRSDEPRRVAKLTPERIAPMARAGVTSAIVGEFWKRQPFDLRLPNHNGKTMHGNCDLCFLKGAQQIVSLIREEPSRAVWWARMETLVKARTQEAGTFRSDRPSYASMQKFAEDQQEMLDEPIEDCTCVD